MQYVILTFYAFDHKVAPCSNQIFSTNLKGHGEKCNIKSICSRYAVATKEKLQHSYLLKSEEKVCLWYLFLMYFYF